MDCLSRLRFVQTVQTVKLFYPTLGIKPENILSPLNEMQFTDCQRTDHHYLFTVCQTVQIVTLLWQTVSVRPYWTTL